MAVMLNGVSRKEICKSCWLNEDGILYHSEGTNSAPCKDFFVLNVGIDKVVMVIWKSIHPFRVSSKDSLLPVKHTCSYEEFKKAYELRASIESQGPGQLDYVDSLVSGKIDYLCRISQDIQIKIIRYLNMKDVFGFMRTNKYFKKLCSRDEVWHGLFLHSDLVNYSSASSLQAVAHTQGWKAYVNLLTRLRKVNRITPRSSLLKKMSAKTLAPDKDIEVRMAPDVSKANERKSTNDLILRSRTINRRFSLR